jgi:hypothetical protein
MHGGKIVSHHILNKIVSIGFELESYDITPVTLREYDDEGHGPMQGMLKFIYANHVINEHVIRSWDTTLKGLRTKFSHLEDVGRMDDVIFDIGDYEYELDRTSFIRSVTIPSMSDIQLIFHTEFKVTYLHPVVSDNILLNYFKLTIQQIMQYYSNAIVIPATARLNYQPTSPIEPPPTEPYDPVFSQDDLPYMPTSPTIHPSTTPKDSPELPYDPVSMDQTMFNYNPSGILDYLHLVITDSENFLMVTDTPVDDIIDTIPWHPQCTIGIYLIDLINIVEYISQFAGYNFDWVHKKSIELKAGIDTTPLEDNMYFLWSMYLFKDEHNLTKGGQYDYKLAVRHPFEEIYTHHLPESKSPFGKNKFHGVTSFPYDGIVLLEIRDFYAQFLLSYTETMESQFPDGVPLSVLDRGTDVLLTY